MDPLAETLNEKLQQWRPETADQVRQSLAKLIGQADQDQLAAPRRPARLGSMQGIIHVPDDFNTAFAEEIERMFYARFKKSEDASSQKKHFPSGCGGDLKRQYRAEQRVDAELGCSDNYIRPRNNCCTGETRPPR